MNSQITHETWKMIWELLTDILERLKDPLKWLFTISEKLEGALKANSFHPLYYFSSP